MGSGNDLPEEPEREKQHPEIIFQEKSKLEDASKGIDEESSNGSHDALVDVPREPVGEVIEAHGGERLPELELLVCNHFTHLDHEGEHGRA